MLMKFKFKKLYKMYILCRSSENDKMEAANPGASESESESSQRSSTGKDFEMVEQDDLES